MCNQPSIFTIQHDVRPKLALELPGQHLQSRNSDNTSSTYIWRRDTASAPTSLDCNFAARPCCRVQEVLCQPRPSLSARPQEYGRATGPAKSGEQPCSQFE